MNGLANPLVGSAAADVALHGFVNIRIARLRLGGQRQAFRQVEPLAGREGFHPIDPGGPFPPVVLRDLPYRQVAGRPGPHQQSLESVDGLDIATTGGSEDSGLELRDLHLEQLPGAPSTSPK